MKTRKTVTEKVIAANKTNAQKSTGPRTESGKRASAANSRSHGLLSKTVVFSSDEERANYTELLELWTRGSDPDDLLEAALIKLIVDDLWQRQQSSTWLAEAVQARRRSSRAIVQALEQQNAENYEATDLPVVNEEVLSKHDRRVGLHGASPHIGAVQGRYRASIGARLD